MKRRTKKRRSAKDDAKIERALARFDFAAAARRYLERHYAWGYAPREHVPCSTQLHTLAGQLLDALAMQPAENEATGGGLRAFRHDDGELDLEVLF